MCIILTTVAFRTIFSKSVKCNIPETKKKKKNYLVNMYKFENVFHWSNKARGRKINST